ncbi:hypothetical protein EMCRGX_G023208 [Ephydatia muelleri]
MALLGTVGPFDPAVDDWVVYCERLEQFFQANGVATAEKQRAVLLSVCGSSTYLLIRNLVSPEMPTDKTYVQLVKMRFHFNSRIQKDAETVAQFVTELKRLSEYCSFGETLDDMLRDRLVCGVRDSRLQRRLLTEKDLTFAKAFELAKLAELAERSAGEIQPPVGNPEPVHVVQAPQPRANQDACYRCGGHHKASECWCRNVECYHCGKQGHLARVCHAKRGDYKEPTQGRGPQRRPQRTQQQPELDSGQKDTYTLFPVQDPSRKPVTLRVLLNDSPLEMEAWTTTFRSYYHVTLKDELGLVKGVTVKLYVDSSATPWFFRPRSVPHALRGRVEQELERLEKTGIIEAIKFSDWATPVVPLVKGDGSIRICGDYKVTINRVANVESYPLPRIDDLLAGLAKGKVFSKLDLAHAYLQLQLDEESRKLATISTHKGLFCYNRLPFGVSSTPAIFQRTMEGILKGIPYVHAYLDDILVMGTSESEHLQILEQMLTRLEEVGIRLKESKCQFLLSSVEYLGYRISGNGIQPTEEKQSYQRCANSSRSKPAEIISGIVELLCSCREKVFSVRKRGISNSLWGQEIPPVLGMGRKFVVHSDHKPLQFLFKEDKPVPTMASARIQRWALTLSVYDYRIVFRAGKENSNADDLSRLPLRESPSSFPVPGDTVLLMEALSDMGSAVSATTIKSWTDRDPVLSRVRRMVLHGWQQQEGVDFQLYEQRKHELSVEDRCVLWGSRVVVPPAREAVVRLLHEGHPGISRMKALVRGVIWWPGLDWRPPYILGSGQLSLGYGCIGFCGAIFSSPSAEQAIRVLRHVFSTHGLPEVLVSDNGSAFTSAQFQTFVKLNGFRHVKSAPYHPASNGLAERAVKEALKKTTGDLETRLARFLFQYRLTPHSTTGQPPAELLMGRKTNYDQHVQSRTFQVGDEVYVVNHRGSLKWLPGVVVKLLGPLNLIVKVKGGQEAHNQIDHVCARTGGGGGEKGRKGINNDDSNIEDDDPLPPVLDTPPVPALPPGSGSRTDGPNGCSRTTPTCTSAPMFNTSSSSPR